MIDYVKTINEAAEYVSAKTNIHPELALVLGSGLNGFASQIQIEATIPYGEIPHMRASTVPGHQGAFLIGRVGSREIIAMAGRLHMYEGYTAREVTFPVRVLRALGVKKLILTNAAGGVNQNFRVGDFMAITDHINLIQQNPLTGPNDDELGERFVDMSEAYDREMLSIARNAAARVGETLREGVYMQFAGPSFETPAEIRMARALGADAVGMSTVPEVIAARHAGLRVFGLSVITNMAAGMLAGGKLSHEEVMRAWSKAEAGFTGLMTELVAKI